MCRQQRQVSFGTAYQRPKRSAGYILVLETSQTMADDEKLDVWSYLTYFVMIFLYYVCFLPNLYVFCKILLLYIVVKCTCHIFLY